MKIISVYSMAKNKHKKNHLRNPNRSNRRVILEDIKIWIVSVCSIFGPSSLMIANNQTK